MKTVTRTHATLCGTHVRLTSNEEGQIIGRQVLAVCCLKPTIKPATDRDGYYCMSCDTRVDYSLATFEGFVEANREHECPIPFECADHTEWKHLLDVLEASEAREVLAV